MNIHRFMVIACVVASAILLMSGCSVGLTDCRYTLELPELPPAWVSLRDGICWRIEWLNTEGAKEELIYSGGRKPDITLPSTYASAVFAFPFWPQRDIMSGVFRPAGAIFPFDVSGTTLVLSWRGGVDAALYRELARAAAQGEAAAGNRLPWNFNWPRFRELYNDPAVHAAVRADPWLADWPSIAAQTIRSGFDKRRLVPQARTELSIPVTPGPWAGTSPFAPPLFFEGGPVFPVRKEADVWVSAEGILYCSRDAWIFHKW